MEPCNFEQANFVFGPPAGQTEDDVGSLNAYRGPVDSGRICVISCFKPTAEELKEISQTGRVWLVVSGSKMPPVALLGKSPFSD